MLDVARSARAAGPDRRLLRLGRRRHATRAARRRRLRCRAADGHAAPPRDARPRRRDAPRVLGADAGRRAVRAPSSTRSTGPRRAGDHHARPRDRVGSIGSGGAAGSTRTLLADVGWPSTAAPRCYVCGPTPFVEAVADALVDARARRQPTSEPSASDPQEPDSRTSPTRSTETPRPGALAEVFVAEMTTAVTTCAACGDTRRVGELARLHAGARPRAALRVVSRGAAAPRSNADDRAWLDLRGVQVLQFEMPGEPTGIR